MKRTKSEKGSFRGTLLRLFKLGKSFQESVSLQERDAHVSVPRNIYYGYQKEIRATMLEAERRKAKALEEMQRQRMRMF